MHDVDFYLDFISPYVWLALEGAEAFAARHRVRFTLRPVVYAKILESRGLVGPVETPAKRAYTFDDVVRCAARAGLPCVGPPLHPFRSLEAQRALIVAQQERDALPLARALAHATWSEGRDLTDVDVLASILREEGHLAEGLAQRIQDPAVKQALAANKQVALEAGVFGVPTFAFDGELFWGHDRMDHLAQRLAGELAPARPKSRPMIERVGLRRARFETPAPPDSPGT